MTEGPRNGESRDFGAEVQGAVPGKTSSGETSQERKTKTRRGELTWVGVPSGPDSDEQALNEDPYDIEVSCYLRCMVSKS